MKCFRSTMAVAFLILSAASVRAATVDTRSFSVSATVVGGCIASAHPAPHAANRCAGATASTQTRHVEDATGSHEVTEVQY